MIVLVAPGCSEERERDGAGGVHPAGWIDPQHTSFHGLDLRTRNYPLDECRDCHGDDFGGGPVEVGCSTASCHTQGVSFCGTCHGDSNGPRPATGAHGGHAAYCTECHQVPANLAGHPRGTGPTVTFSGLAAANAAEPSWNPATQSCSNTYCHGAESPAWDDPTPLGCDGCHQGSPATGHLDGRLALEVQGCNGCHGTGASGAPPVGLDGATAASDPGVGAHRRHLDPQLAGRIGKTVACAACHPVPGNVLAPGHLDLAAPADVVMIQGSYQAADQTCTVWCHGDATPRWTDDSGAARNCDSCHGFPPVLATNGSPHPASAPDVAECRACHAFEVSTHVDGVVTFP
ncbi:MAG TPA: CxxxxCH/CxxCH domain-containing protein [Kofleriaceae bacterium]|nr:CxxxxCH/CxxCH domain-containing protein [Kofleriaceae bacterium]